MSGAGNDFVVVDNRDGQIKDPGPFAVRVCHRRFGIGADGILMVERHESAAFTMKYYNADGSNAGMCGNGGRCIAKFAFDNKIVTEQRFMFEGFGHLYTAERISSDEYRLAMKDPFGYLQDQDLEIDGKHIVSNYLNTGTDHAVVFMDGNTVLGSLNTMEVIRIGSAIRYHQTYKPLGVNANFVSQLEANSIQIRTYERGVEDETLACGTGSVASALLSSLRYGMKSPIKVQVQSGEFLQIGFERTENSFRHVTLQGSAVNVFNGVIDLDL